MKKFPLSKKLIYLATLIFSAIYLTWRGIYTLPLNGSLFALLFGLLLWFSEIVSNFTGLILIWSRNKVEDIAFPEVQEANYPHVDVIIATHNEEPDLLKKQ